MHLICCNNEEIDLLESLKDELETDRDKATVATVGYLSHMKIGWNLSVIFWLSVIMSLFPTDFKLALLS